MDDMRLRKQRSLDRMARALPISVGLTLIPLGACIMVLVLTIAGIGHPALWGLGAGASLLALGIGLALSAAVKREAPVFMTIVSDYAAGSED